MASAKSKVDYLKRYGYQPEDSSSKKKTKRVKKTSNVRGSVPKSKIVDDDIDINAVAPDYNDDNELETGEEAPQIAGFVDERPTDVQKMELFATNRWRPLGKDDTSDAEDILENHASNQKVRHDSDSDASPPTQRSRHDSDASPPRQRLRHDSDASPPRQRVRHDSDASPPRQRLRHDSDASPPRRKVQQDSDMSPPRGKLQHRSSRHNGRSNASPLRQRSRRDSDASSPSDTSPPRKKPHQHPRSSPSGRKTTHGSSTSSSVPPFGRNVRDDSDSSPPRQMVKRKHDSSPPLRKTRHEMSNSPSRRKTNYDSDTSPPRRNVRRHSKDAFSDRSSTRTNEQDCQRRRIHANVASDYFPCKSRNSNGDSNDSDPSPPRKSRENPTLQKRTLDGKKAGLQDSKTLKLENKAAKERERLLFEMMEEDMSGRHAKTVLRDRSTGMRRNLEEEKRKEMEEAAIKAEQEAKYNQWGKGIKQTEMQRSRLQQDLHEISKPLARYGDDEDLDKALREQLHDGDPMLAFIKKKKATKVDGKELPKYNGPEPPPNRFGIRPGYRWDGVDRSNGFEKSWFARKSNKVAAEEEAYKWSVEDM